jgi:cholesterol oxidase
MVIPPPNSPGNGPGPMRPPMPAGNGTRPSPALDYDVIVVGSGFGGSVAALRSAEKGYRVMVLEAGRRFADHDFARTSWQLPRWLWAPRLGCFGIQRIHLLNDVLILAGAGVGGGSLVYANTLYVPPPPFFADPQWSDITDWQAELAPYYALATQMLGVVPENPCDGPVEQIMRQTARDLGVEHTFRKTPAAVFFGRDGALEPGVTVPDPYFGGAGPQRTGCTQCGNCMVGCRVGAKNTLVKNYLGLAERLGVQVQPLRTVTDVRPIDPDDPSRGWQVTTERTGAWLGRDRQMLTAADVVLAAGAWGTQTLLHALKADGVLPRLSDRLGAITRTNSEALIGAITRGVPAGQDFTRGVAITSSFHPDETTHIENVRYGRGSNAMGALCTLMADGRDDGRRGGRIQSLLRQLWAQPSLLRFLVPPVAWRFSERTIIGLVMQPVDNSITIVPRKRRLRGGWRLSSRSGHGVDSPRWNPVGHRAMRALAATITRQTGLPAATGAPATDLADIPMTAHFIGGAIIGATPERGVVDAYGRVFGYPGLHIMDGSTLSANLGVNPSLTITAQAERAMAMWPDHGEPDPRPAPGSTYQPVTAVRPHRDAVPRATVDTWRLPIRRA